MPGEVFNISNHKCVFGFSGEMNSTVLYDSQIQAVLG